MGRSSLVIACGLLAVGGSTTLNAQHSAGHVSGGGHGYPVQTNVGHGTLGTGGSARSVPGAGQLIYPTPIGLQPTYSGYTGINLGAIPSSSRRGESSRGRGGYAGGYVAYPYYYSGFDSYSDPYTDGNYPAQDPNAGANLLLGDQVARLAAEVSALRAEREAANQDSQGMRPQYDAPPPDPHESAPVTPPLTLVLRSGKKVQLKSYAVMGQDIWDFSSQPAKKITAASVDLKASRSATEADGGEFPDLR